MTRFLIIGHPRCGSTLLREALAQHPGVKIFGELFHPLEDERKARHFVRRNEDGVVYYRGGEHDAVAFVRRHVWSARNEGFQAVGFKLFAEHVACAGTRGLLPWLAGTPGLRVIDMVRHNLLDMWVSRRKAEQSGVWREPVKPRPQPQARRDIAPLEASPQLLQRYFEELEAGSAAMRRALAGAAWLELGYDRLADDFEGAMAQVFAFLSLDPVACSMTTRKQNASPHSIFIKNYATLKAFFAGSRYAGFFRE